MRNKNIMLNLKTMKTVLIFLAEGFEEIEAITTIDLLRRAGLSVVSVAVGDSLEVAGAHYISVLADKHISDIDELDADAYVLPGGLPGVDNLNECKKLDELLLEANASGKLIAAICAAPSILGRLGLLKGKEATCYPSFEPRLGEYVPTPELVVQSGNIITATAAGVTIPFALAIASALVGKEQAEQVAQDILYH